jgi:hypothetical protein
MSALDTGDAEIGANALSTYKGNLTNLPRDTTEAPLVITTPAKKPTKQTLESVKWHREWHKFTVMWKQKTTDDIQADHPMLVWITKQRKMAAKGRLRTWKRKLLDGIGFPFDDSSSNG